MNQEPIQIKRALISVSDKTGIVEFAQALIKENIEIISTGGTRELLRHANIPVLSVEEITQYPEMMDGRVKTLHPRIHGGILGQREKHADAARLHQIEWIDLVVVNLYPFAETIQRADISFSAAIEQIDIGGPALIRGAAKNMQWVSVIVDPKDYQLILNQIKENKNISFITRQQLATKAFLHTATYDQIIYNYLAAQNLKTSESVTKTNFPPVINLNLKKLNDLRYGENPHQSACAYQTEPPSGILSAKQHQGKPLSYNNITDADAGVACLSEFTEPAAVIVKHTNPCGVALGEDIYTAFEAALRADSLSAFGGVVGINRLCDEQTAQAMTDIFLEVIIAPAYTPEALVIFRHKPNLRILEYSFVRDFNRNWKYKFITGGVLIQEEDRSRIQEQDLTFVTNHKPSSDALKSMLFAWSVLKHLKSNAILIAKENKTIGIGAGQVSRIDAVDIALKKAGHHIAGNVLASDAFFPFRDSIDRLAGTGICGIIQPGGSLRDKEVIAACEEHDIPMVFTGKRCFNH